VSTISSALSRATPFGVKPAWLSADIIDEQLWTLFPSPSMGEGQGGGEASGVKKHFQMKDKAPHPGLPPQWGEGK